MARGLSDLRKQAKEMRIPGALIRDASTASQLEALIETYTKDRKPLKQKGSSMAPAKKGSKGKSTPTKKTSGKAAPVKKTAPKKTTSAVRKAAPIKRSPAKKSTPAKKNSTKGAPKKSKPASKSATNEGRFTLGKIDYSVTDGWNPRVGSPPDKIIKAVKKSKGNRVRAYEILKDSVWTFVAKKRADGTKRTLAEAQNMLKYRISRIMWQYALKTGQHAPSPNRAEYGTAGTGTGVYRKGKGGRAAVKASGGTKGRGRGKTAAPAKKATGGKSTPRKAGRKKAGSKR